MFVNGTSGLFFSLSFLLGCFILSLDGFYLCRRCRRRGSVCGGRHRAKAVWILHRSLELLHLNEVRRHLLVKHLLLNRLENCRI